MNKQLCVLVALSVAVTAEVFSAENKQAYLECTPESLFLCEAGKGKCANVPVITLDGGYLIKVDLEKKRSETYEGDNKVSATAIQQVDHHGDLVFLHGYQDVNQITQLPHSWTAVIDTMTGQLTVASVTNGMGFTLTGTCVESAGGQK